MIWKMPGTVRRIQIFMNSVGKLIGNPISDILILKKNQSEEILADALAEYNAEAIPIWRKTFFHNQTGSRGY